MKNKTFKTLALAASSTFFISQFANAATESNPARLSCAELNEELSEFNYPMKVDRHTVFKSESRWEDGQCVLEKTQSLIAISEAKELQEQLLRDADFNASVEDIVLTWQTWQPQGVIGEFWIEEAQSPFMHPGGRVVIHFEPDQYLEPFTAVKQF